MGNLAFTNGAIGHLGFIFSLGLLSGITPCCLPTIMMVITYSVKSPNRATGKLKIINWFILGMMLTLLLLGISFTYVGKIFSNLQYAYILSSIIALLMGLKMIGVLKIPLSPQLSLIPTGKNARLVALLLSVPYAILGSPCTLPVLFTVLSLVIAQASVTAAIPIMLMYGIGRAIPIVLVAVLGTSAQVIFKSKFASKKVSFVLGTKLIFISLYILYEFFIK